MLWNRKAKHSATSTADLIEVASGDAGSAAAVHHATSSALEQPLLRELSDAEDTDEEELSSLGHSESKLKALNHNTADDAAATRTPFEQRLERYLNWAHSPLVQKHGVRLLVACLAVVFPILFGFIANFHSLCDTPAKNNCEPRNFLMNLDIQILTGLFTIKAIICFPWRAAAVIHLLQIHNKYLPPRSNAIGHDIFGQETDEIFHHLPHRSRKIIALLNLGDCLFQFLNQCTRVYFYTYALANIVPGKILVDTFWPLSALCGVGGGTFMDRQVQLLKGQYPEKWGTPAPKPSAAVEFYKQHGPNPFKVAAAAYRRVREGTHKEEDRV